MYLKSLELQGFKSFPEKVKLTFSSGLTAVVGPNGSGKSNIGDAVRWVLGEQSTKTLRGNRMEDVIFSGTKNRKAMGFASVTLLIDNSTGLLGEEYGQEVSITRKLYRSGDSEYRINGKSVRLKDINELFMDTGMGKDGYSIIGQGRIAEIVSAKSTDRRDIFEEAAGISKFRYKKEEAKHRLDLAQENLIRLQDIASELEGRIDPLRIQSEKAKQFLEFSEKQKKLEISLWVNQIGSIQEQKNELSDELLKAQAEYQNIEIELEKSEEIIHESYKHMQESTVKIQDIRDNISKSEETVSKLREECAVGENDISHSKKLLENLENQNAENSVHENNEIHRLNSLKEKKQKLLNEKSCIDEKLFQVQKKLSELEMQLSELDKSFLDKSNFVKNLYNNQTECRVSIESLSRRNEEITAQQTTQTMRIAALQNEKNEYHIKTKTAEENAKNASERASDLKSKFYNSRQQNDEIQKQVNSLQTEQNKIIFELKEKRQRKKLLHDMEQNMEGFAGSVKTILKAENGRPDGVHGTVSQIITTQQVYGIAIETALGGAMQNIIVDDENSAKKWIRYLSQKHAGRATFLPVTTIKGKMLQESGLQKEDGFIDIACNLVQCDILYKEIIRSLLGRIVVVKDLDSASSIANKYNYRFRIVTLDGQVVNAGGSYTGGSVQRSGGMITRKSEIAKLEEEIDILSLNEQENQQKLFDTQQTLKKFTEDLQGLQKNIDSAVQLEISSKAEYEKCCYLEKQLEKQLDDYKEQYKQLSMDLDKINEELEAQKLRYQNIQSEIKKEQEVLQQKQDSQIKIQNSQSELVEQQTQIRLKLVEMDKDIETISNEYEKSSDTKDVLHQRQIQIQNDIQLQEEKISELNNSVEMAKKKISELVLEKERLNIEIVQWQTSHDVQSQKVRKIQDSTKEFNIAKERYTKIITRLEERKNTSQNELDNIINRMLEQYELTRSEAQKLAEPVTDVSSVQRELSSLKNKIRSLGSVNVSAIEEYKEVSERWNFLKNQMKDATDAKNELENLIISLTDDMCRIFTESFHTINKNFKQIFKELFEGGEAELILLDPENVLESGIEIHVSPPGKVIKNLISLSGGEQSFVAIAIYFAILRLRPTPFCILDEIDAALDEGNVQKYARYLQNFTNTTQFILVTHRRSAMEEANVLYGVTMQEDGISRLLRMEQDDFLIHTEEFI